MAGHGLVSRGSDYECSPLVEDTSERRLGRSCRPNACADSKSVFYTAKVGSNVELFRVTLDGKSEQLTETPKGSMHYHPAASPDGKWLAYGSKRDGVRQLYVMRLSDRKEWRITDLKKGHAAMWAHWQPAANEP